MPNVVAAYNAFKAKGFGIVGVSLDNNAEAWKKAAHAVFDPLWKYGRFRGHRNAAYAWLAQKMGLPVEKTHIGMFDVGQCRKAIEIIEKETKGDRYGRYQKDPR